MASENYYKILHIPSDANQEVIKKAYYRLCLQWHPDKNPGSAEAERIFKCISRAYDTLSDPQKRRTYDLTLFETTREHGAMSFSFPSGLIGIFTHEPIFSFGDTMTSTNSGINGGGWYQVIRERVNGVETVTEYQNGILKSKTVRRV